VPLVLAAEVSPRAQFYVDGLLKNTASDNVTGSFSSQNQVHIGRRADDCCYVNGAMDDVRIYSRALSATEVNQIADQKMVEPNL
jgi:hypothetical protein